MSEPLHAVEEEVKELAREADEGRSARTPLIVLSGITGVAAAVIAVLLAVTFLAYYLS